MAYTEFYCQTTANNLNAGSTTSDASAFTYTSAVIAGGWDSATGIFTVMTGNPSTDGVAVGDFASVYATVGATVATFVGRVTARSTTTITVSLTAVSGTPPATDALGATTLKIGGAWKGPNAAVGFPFNFVASAMVSATGIFPRVNFKSGTNYAITAAMTQSTTGPLRFSGYTTSAGDGGKATFDGGTTGASYVLLNVTGTQNDFDSLIFGNNGLTGSANGVTCSGARCLFTRTVVHDVRGIGLTVTGAGSTMIECEVYGANQSNTGSNYGLSCSGIAIRCIAHDNSGTNTDGFLIGSAVIDCIADTNGKRGFVQSSNVVSTIMVGCDSYNNVSDGVDFSNNNAGQASVYIENCNFVKNGGWGINVSGTVQTRGGAIMNCGFGSGTQVNTSGTITTTTALSAMVTGTVTYASNVTPWVDPANGDFRINLAAAKGAGRGSFTQTQAGYTGAIGYPDIGSAQHLDAGGASATSFTY